MLKDKLDKKAENGKKTEREIQKKHQLEMYRTAPIEGKQIWEAISKLFEMASEEQLSRGGGIFIYHRNNTCMYSTNWHIGENIRDARFEIQPQFINQAMEIACKLAKKEGISSWYNVPDVGQPGWHFVYTPRKK